MVAIEDARGLMGLWFRQKMMAVTISLLLIKTINIVKKKEETV